MLRRNLPLKGGLMLAGLAYFQVFSQLDVSPVIKNFLILAPVQISALLYFGYVYWVKPNGQDHSAGRSARDT